ncbi:MAG: ATP-binding protein [Pseudobdellovibrionaceae bacterium]
MRIDRYLFSQIKEDLSEKMVFIGGPRQVGKTTLAKQFIKSENQYFNWDSQKDKTKILKDEIDVSLGLIIFDEIHKYSKWRGLVKGYFDKYYPKLNFIVTGSARLDYFRKGGDSLVGRYHYLRLHPLSLRELNKNPNKNDLSMLIQFGGFPEPFFKQNSKHLGRWQLERISRIITQDLKDVENVKDLSLLELLAQTLQTRVGSALSIKSFQEDLQVSPNTIERWIGILELLYYCFRISPFGAPKIKAVKKTQKLYLWDWSEVENPGARFENLVASQLLKYCHYQEDTMGIKTELRYFKDVVTEKEIDFIVLQKGKAVFAVECKTVQEQLSRSLVMNGKRLKIPRLFQVHNQTKDYGQESSGRVLPFEKFCFEMGMP